MFGTAGNWRGRNQNTEQLVSFLGAGLYDHHIPAAVAHLVGRSDFYTAYTPYQAEVSQGTLQSIYEYQSAVCFLTGMDVANASVYDAGTAIVEAVGIARATTRRDRVVFLDTVHPDHLAVAKTYAAAQGWEITIAPSREGRTDLGKLTALVDKETAAVVVQQPNFVGQVEDLLPIAEADAVSGRIVHPLRQPNHVGIIDQSRKGRCRHRRRRGAAPGWAPALWWADIRLFAAKAKYLRRLPGRIVGKTTDLEGRVGYVLTLQAREQHIRRERASSNICSNQALNALAATIYLALLGPEGLKDVAYQSVQKAHYLANQLTTKGLGDLVWSGPFANEFVFRPKMDLDTLWAKSLEAGYLPGLNLGKMPFLPESIAPSLEGTLLMAVTEKRTRAELDGLVSLWEGLMAND